MKKSFFDAFYEAASKSGELSKIKKLYKNILSGVNPEDNDLSPMTWYMLTSMFGENISDIEEFAMFVNTLSIQGTIQPN